MPKSATSWFPSISTGCAKRSPAAIRARRRRVSFVDEARNPGRLRPSIETSVHAVIPEPIVAHIHCVETIALAVRADGEALVADRLRPLRDAAAVYVPYRRPGLPLSKAIAERLTPRVNVLVLANHGLVVAGRDRGRSRRSARSRLQGSGFAGAIGAAGRSGPAGAGDRRQRLSPAVGFRHSCARARRPQSRAGPRRLALSRSRHFSWAGRCRRAGYRNRRRDAPYGRARRAAADDRHSRSRRCDASRDDAGGGRHGALSRRCRLAHPVGCKGGASDAGAGI